jgi:SNF2 family DNA or RNA helicase
MIIDVPTRSILLNTKHVQHLRNLLPRHTQLIDHKGHNLAVHYTLETAKVLRNLRYDVPSPIRSFYNWPGKYIPFAHQIDTSEFLTFNRRCFVLSEMGTAKSASALWAADYLMNVKQLQRVLIVAPLSTLDMVWRKEIFDVLMHRTAVILKGDAQRRRELLAKNSEFYIVNYEGLPIIAHDLKSRPDIGLVIVDEAAAYRNGTNDRYDTLLSVVGQKWKASAARRMWLLTGTPCPNAPSDAWALAKLVDPLKVPHYFTTFKRQVMFQASTHKWIAKPGASEKAYAVLQPAIRFKKSDCLDLPPVTFSRRECALTKEQQEAYREMKNYMVAEAEATQISAVNAADQIGKLQQILCGAVRDKNGVYRVLNHAPRLNVLLECIEQASAKVIVIIPYKGITYELAKEVSLKYTCDVVNGDISQTKRAEIWQRFKHTPDPHVVLCHPKVMAHGLTLVEADMMVFYAPIRSNELAQQVMERMNRPGQTRSMNVIRIGGAPLEWNIYNVVESKQIDQQSILDLYRKEMMT